MIFTVILGSNSGDRQHIINEATNILSATVGKVISASSFYNTAPWGFESSEFFINQVVIFESSLTPEVFLKHCLDTEQKLGRMRIPGSRYSSRTIDIDILFCEQQIIESPNLTVPHPRIAERRFVLVPLNEVMPGFIHPALHKKISELLSLCPDKLIVKQIV